MDIKTVEKFVKKTNGLDRFLIVIILFGGLITLISLFRGILIDRKVEVEYISGKSLTNSEANYKIFVDIEGAVINPGVFELSENSRVKDVLVMAGGLSDGADRTFCEKNINMAEILKDGQKIYIPFSNNTYAQQGYAEAILSSKKVNINNATIAELDTLWGIGSARAESIVKNRPYQNIDDLITKGVLTKSLVDRNREMMSVY